MKVEQIYSIINDITDEILGETAVVKEDLSNVVDIGKSIFDATSVDNYVNKLLDRIGRMVFVNQVYAKKMPNIPIPTLISYSSFYSDLLLVLIDSNQILTYQEIYCKTNGLYDLRSVFYISGISICVSKRRKKCIASL